MAITNSNKPTATRLKLVKGNELANIVMESFVASAFQPTTDTTAVTHGMYLGLQRDKIVRVRGQYAALGARGDYILFENDSTVVGTTTWAMLLHGFFVDALDYTGVPTAVQHAIFGKYSPFPTPVQPVSNGMMRGIDRQNIEVELNVAPTADATYISQLIRGSSDTRVQVRAIGATTAVTRFDVRLKPNSDGVFVIPRGARLWVGSGTPT